jgi:alpha-amylase
MKTICLYFQVHQPFRLKRYRFFDIGNEHYYYDDFANRTILRKIADRCYIPTNQIILELIKLYGKKFKISFSISGTALDQFAQYAPDVLESFKKLAKTGNVEFLAETYSHTMASLKNKDEFIQQVKQHSEKIEEIFGKKPTVFRNTELIYSDNIGEMVAEMGFKSMLTEGAKHILGWKSPNYLYYNAFNPKLKIQLKNYKLSDDIAFRFSDKNWAEWPLTTEKYVSWLNQIPKEEKIINLFMDYETFGEHQPADSGIFEFLKSFIKAIFVSGNFSFSTTSEVAEKNDPVAALHVPYPISWADEERDLTAWLGNELQQEAFRKLYDMAPLVKKVSDPQLLKDWKNLQTSDHFYYMCTKFFMDGSVHQYFNPYSSPYDAFINYMNVLSDFIDRVNKNTEDMQRLGANPDENLEALINKYETTLQRLKEEAKLKDSKLIKPQTKPKATKKIEKKSSTKSIKDNSKKNTTENRKSKSTKKSE